MTTLRRFDFSTPSPPLHLWLLSLVVRVVADAD